MSSGCWRDYVEKTESDLSTNPKKIWDFVGSIKTSNSLSTCLVHNNNTLSDGVDMANCFADFFESIYSKNNNTPFVCDYNHDLGTFANMEISISEIYESLNSLKSNGGSGVDDISPINFKSCSFILSRVLWLTH